MLAVLSGPDSQFLGALVIGIPACIAAVNSWQGKRAARAGAEQATAANEAVNNVDKSLPTVREVAVRVAELQEWQTGQLEALRDQLAHVRVDVQDCATSVGQIDRKLARHLEWHQIDTEQGARAAGPPLGALDERQA